MPIAADIDLFSDNVISVMKRTPSGGSQLAAAASKAVRALAAPPAGGYGLQYAVCWKKTRTAVITMIRRSSQTDQLLM